MRIAIITLPLQINYGGILQAYALQKILQRMGNEVVLIEKERTFKLLWWKKPIVYAKRLIKKYILGKKIYIFKEAYDKNVWDKSTSLTRLFVNKQIKRVIVKSFSDIKSNDFDCFVVGSDQVWREMYANWGFGNVEIAYLNFTRNWKVKRIAYAASFGTDKWEYNKKQTLICSNLLKKFDCVSVREESGVRLCKDYLNVSAVHLLDPTLLLSSIDYVYLINQKDCVACKNKGIFSYFLDKTYDAISLERVMKRKMNDKVFNFSLDNNTKEEILVKPNVEYWLSCILNSSFVLTDSFHACVFSIIFKKQFIVLANEERGRARLDSLLAALGLSNHIVTSYQDFIHSSTFLYKPINYDEVYTKLNQLRKDSIGFLKNIIYEK